MCTVGDGTQLTRQREDIGILGYHGFEIMIDMKDIGMRC